MKNHRHLCQDCAIPGLLSRQNAPHVALEGDSRVRQAEGLANIAVRGSLTLTNARGPDALLRCASVEPWNVDIDAQFVVLARTRSYARWCAVVAAHGSRLLTLFGCLGDELLSTRHSMPRALLREACGEACLHVVPERLPPDIG